MSVELDELVLQVEETQGVEESVIVLLQGIEARIAELVTELKAEQVDTAKLVELKDDLHASEVALAAAAAAVPPPAPSPEPSPEP